jgi:predicted amidophosphoribosyltransferase
MEIHRTELVTLQSGATHLVELAALFPYAGDVRSQVLNLKYHNKRHVAIGFATQLAMVLLESHGNRFQTLDAVTWAPTSSMRKRTRGMDQAELITRHVSAQTGIPWKSLLRRTTSTHQTGASRQERLCGPEFIASRSADGLSILVVDDVLTTGSTFRASAAALLNAGASYVTCLAVTGNA